MMPNLALNFTLGSLDPRITLARANATATRTNSVGVVEVVPADTARFDYDPVTLACRGLLIEEQRANSLTYSQRFDVFASNSPNGWETSNTTISANAAVAPDGASTADKLIANNGAVGGQINQTITGTSQNTFSVFAKAAEFTQIYLGFNTGAGACFDLSSGTVVLTDAGFSSSITSVGSGWYRCSITGTGITGRYRIYLASSGSKTISGNGTSGVLLWGAQLEAGAFATSYIPTTTTSLTRNADVATMTGTNFSSFWRATRGGVLVRARPSTVSGARPWVQFDDNTADNIIALRGNTTNPELYIKAASDQAQIDAGTIASSTSYRLAGTWDTNNCAASLNGAAPVLDTSATIPAVTQMRIGSDGTNYLNGHVESIEYYDQRLLDASLQVVSSPAGYRSIIGPVMRDTIIR